MHTTQYLLLSLIMALAACSHTTATAPKTVANSLEDAIQKDLARAGDQPKHVLRHNPVLCRCPPFELELGARWVRVALTEIDVPDSPAFKLHATALEDTKKQRLVTYPVHGSLLSTIQRCGQGAPYLTFTIEPIEEETTPDPVSD